MRKEACFLCLLLLLAGGIFSGCARQVTGESYVSPVLPASTAVNAIAEDAVRTLSAMYPPGHTAIELVRPQVKDSQGNSIAQTPMDAFSTALENGLRQRGFSIVPDSQQLRLAWTLDGVIADPAASNQKIKPDEINWWLRLQMSSANNFEARTLTRMYDGKGTPLAGFAESL